MCWQYKSTNKLMADDIACVVLVGFVVLFDISFCDIVIVWTFESSGREGRKIVHAVWCLGWELTKGGSSIIDLAFPTTWH